MQIRVLGCSGGIGKGLRTTSLLIDDDILIDCGTGVGDLTMEELVKIRHIFITHTHLDHLASLPLLVDTVFDHLNGEPIKLHLLPESLKTLDEHLFNWKLWPDFFVLPEAGSAVMQPCVMEPGKIVEIRGREIEMIPVEHAVPAVGYRVTSESGKTFAFSGDSCENDTLWEGLNKHERLDILFVECAYANHDKTLSKLARHYCPESLSNDLKKLNHQPEVYITHLKPGDESEILSELEAAMPDRNPKALNTGDSFQL